MRGAELFKETRAVQAKNRAVWRKWLIKNHSKENRVWLILYHKKSNVQSIYYDEAVEEALCFGWIDSVKYNRDDESAYQMFTPRKPKSNWSKLNKERVEKMTKAGLMTPAGQKVIDCAKENGNWEVPEEIDSETIPADLDLLFQKNKVAKVNFEAFSSAAKKMMISWILAAKRPETRAKRIKETVLCATQNKKSFP
jgi:uncharacterized protein YdeI (YjbR/CyaY-like superfamily)